jgi:hypothetical protein
MPTKSSRFVQPTKFRPYRRQIYGASNRIDTGGKPYAKFVFYYRSKEKLQELGMIKSLEAASEEVSAPQVTNKSKPAASIIQTRAAKKRSLETGNTGETQDTEKKAKKIVFDLPIRPIGGLGKVGLQPPQGTRGVTFNIPIHGPRPQ